MGLKESGLRASVRSVSTVVPAFFDVAITNTNSPINEGDVLVVDYSVDNTGDSFETQDIRLEIDSVQEDADLDVSLSGGASDTGTLEWDTTGQGADTYEATVLSDDDSDTVTVEIPDAFFDVAIQSTNSPVEEGETLNVDYFVDNTGGVEDTQDIRLEIDNTQEDVDTGVTLDSGTSTTGTLQWDTTNESGDTYSATVLSDDDSDSVTVEIEGDAIPDSEADHQWNYEEGSGTVVSDSIGSLDLDYSGISQWDPSAGARDTHAVLDGVDDGANIGDSVLTHFISDVTGTIFQWAYWDDSGQNYLWVSDVTRSGNGFHIRVDRTRLTVGGDTAEASGSTPPIDEWIAYAMVADGSSLYHYRAEPPDYDVTLIDSATAPSSGSGTWDDDVGVHFRPVADDIHFGGGVDLAFADSIGWSESQLQQFVDDSKQFYE